MKLNFGAFGDCVKKIVERGRMTDGEAKQILQEVADRAETMRLSGVADPFVTAAADMAARLTESAKKAHADALRNALIRNNLMAEIDRQGGLLAAAETIRSLLHGTNKGSRDNVQSQWRGLTASGRPCCRASCISRASSTQRRPALWIRRSPRRCGRRRRFAERGREGVEGRANHRLCDQSRCRTNARERLNSAGARIGEAMDYVAHQEHDPRKMRRAAGPGQSPDAAFAA